MLVTEWSLRETRYKWLRDPFDFLDQGLLLLATSQTKHQVERLVFTFSNHAHQNGHQLRKDSRDQSCGTDEDELVDDVHHRKVQLQCLGRGQKLAVRILEDVRKQLEVLSISGVVVLLPKLTHLNELGYTRRKMAYQFHCIDSERRVVILEQFS